MRPSAGQVLQNLLTVLAIKCAWLECFFYIVSFLISNHTNCYTHHSKSKPTFSRISVHTLDTSHLHPTFYWKCSSRQIGPLLFDPLQLFTACFFLFLEFIKFKFTFIFMFLATDQSSNQPSMSPNAHNMHASPQIKLELQIWYGAFCIYQIFHVAIWLQFTKVSHNPSRLIIPTYACHKYFKNRNFILYSMTSSVKEIDADNVCNTKQNVGVWTFYIANS